MDRDKTLEILQERLATAKQRNEEASAHFHQILKEMYDIPCPDGITSFERAARSYRRSLRELRTAQEQMSHFLLHAAVPPDLDPGRMN